LISISKLVTESDNYGDKLRYSVNSSGNKHGALKDHGPVVVWNVTKACNLKCIHCYAKADSGPAEGELNTQEAKEMIDDLVDFKVPVLLISGGEPLIRPDIFELCEYAISKGIRVTISTNGTLITPEMAKKIKEIGISYVGISLDGLEETNNKFRGNNMAFQKALEGIRNCKAVDQKVGLRFAINKHNYKEIDGIFKLIEDEKIPRVCFYHLVYSGRGKEMIEEDISHEETRKVIDNIVKHTIDFYKKGDEKEILTVDNHCDAVYIYKKYLEKDPERAERIYDLIKRNGGNRSGIAIGEIDWLGNVHADQFTMNHTFGNIREKKFSKIWTEGTHPIQVGMKDRKPLLKGRCSKCKYLELCNGNFRPRAEAVFDDFWMEDPACYLTDKEIGLED